MLQILTRMKAILKLFILFLYAVIVLNRWSVLKCSFYLSVKLILFIDKNLKKKFIRILEKIYSNFKQQILWLFITNIFYKIIIINSQYIFNNFQQIITIITTLLFKFDNNFNKSCPLGLNIVLWNCLVFKLLLSNRVIYSWYYNLKIKHNLLAY